MHFPATAPRLKLHGAGPALGVLTCAVAICCLIGAAPEVAAQSITAPALVTGGGTALVNGAALPAASALPLHVSVPAGVVVSDVKYVLDGTYLGAVAAPYNAPISALAVGSHKIRWTVDGPTGAVATTTRFTVTSTSPTSTPTTPAPPTSTPPTSASPTATPQTSTAPATTPAPGGLTVNVHDAVTLQAALSTARPGETIVLADGRYLGSSVKDPSGADPGRFRSSMPGTSTAPIIVEGSRAAVLDGGGTSSGSYGFHLKNVQFWTLKGFTVSDASKGIVLDGSSHVTLDGVAVTNIGDEGVHFRAFSSDNILKNSDVTHTGVVKPAYGEGVYLGSAHSNWGTYSNGLPDNSDRNVVTNNYIADTGAEDVDIKEGTTGGLIENNYFGGDATAGQNFADSWIDVKGNGYLVSGNHGVHTSKTLDPALYKRCGGATDPAYANAQNAPFCNGFEVHTAVAGWGQKNTFTKNVLDVGANTGNLVVGIWVQSSAVGVGNLIHCDNLVTAATAGNYATNRFTLLSCTG